MTRLDLLKIVVGQARANGFEFRRWYTTRLGLPWINSDAAFLVLASQQRYYALLFAHDFASTFWKPGSEITFQVPRQTFQRAKPDGSFTTVTRKPFTRRTARKDVWRYHLREMAAAEEPLRYIRKYLRVEEELGDFEEEGDDSTQPGQVQAAAPTEASEVPATGKKPARGTPRPLPSDLPAFLRRPYP